jgi:hypothetical protein
MKKALSIILALILCIAIAVPALADDAGGYEEISMNGFMSNGPWWGMFGVDFEAVRMEWGPITFYSEETGVFTEDSCSILTVKPGSKVAVDGAYGVGVEDAPETFCAIVNAYKLRSDGSYEMVANDVIISSGVIEDWPLGKAVGDGGEIAALLELPGGFGDSRYVRIDEAPAEVPAAPDGVSVKVNGVAVVFPDAKPFIDENNRTMVPLRAVAEALGLTVSWDGSAREASFTDGSKTIVFPIGSTMARTEDGSFVEMDTAAVIVSDRTFAPIRYLAQHFGYTVGWDGAARTVLIG